MTVKELKEILSKCHDNDIVEVSCDIAAEHIETEYAWLKIVEADMGFIEMREDPNDNNVQLLLLVTGDVMGC